MQNNHTPEKEDAAWELLKKKSHPVTVSPFFCRNVLREARQTRQRSSWQGIPWLKIALPAFACILLLSVVLSPSVTPSASGQSEVAEAAIDFQTIQNLDLLVYSEESALWLDPYSF